MKSINKKHIKIGAIAVILTVIALNTPVRFQIGEVSFIVGNDTFFYTRYGGVEQRYRRETWGGFISPNGGIFSAELD